MFEMQGKYTNARIMIDNIESECIAQIQKMLNHPAFTNQVRIMPDTHAGKGSVIGFTMPMNPTKLIPNVVGYDVGCGMFAMPFDKDMLKISLEKFDMQIRRRVPFGFETNDDSLVHMKDQFPWRELQSSTSKFCANYHHFTGKVIVPPRYSIDWVIEMADRVGINMSRLINSIGTLGGGNHFIEVGIAEQSGDLWITIHTGSRNLGKKVCEYWQNIAEKKMRKLTNVDMRKEIDEIRHTAKDKTQLQGLIENIKKGYHTGIDKELTFLEGGDTIGYMFDMMFAQKYAEFNRRTIMKSIIRNDMQPNGESIESVHNYISPRDMVIRKGAIESYVGQRQIIPFNMRDGILIVEGLSSMDWNCSAPHGAGRVMSRSKAKKELNVDVFKGQMEGIYSTSVTENTLDEAPDSYKDCKLIEDAIQQTCSIIDRVKPIMNLKDNNEKISWKDKREQAKIDKRSKRKRKNKYEY